MEMSLTSLLGVFNICSINATESPLVLRTIRVRQGDQYKYMISNTEVCC